MTMNVKCIICTNDMLPIKRPQGGGNQHKTVCSSECDKIKRQNYARDAYWNSRLKKFNLTTSDLDDMLARQQHKCLGCKVSISNDTGRGRKRAALDHNHETNKVRGLLCSNCNTTLGLVGENKSTLRRLMAYLSYDRTKTHIYLVGALKNPEIPHLAQTLRKEGYAVFAEWHNPGPEADMCWQEHEKLKGSTYKEAMAGSHVENVFYYDQAYIDLADVVVLVMPAGRSGHLELGYAAGSGKKTLILLDQEPDRYDIMPRFATGICNNLNELLEELKK